MISYEREIESVRPILGGPLAEALIARERRAVFSIYPELRIAAWGGALLLASAAGVLLKNNLDRIGRLGLAALIGLAAAACYAWVTARRTRTTFVNDYVLLLGALLVSAGVAFVETQWKLLGEDWGRHLLLLAIVHGATAYLYRSRLVLSLSITALAGWMGIERSGLASMDGDPVAFALRAFACAALLVLWRLLDERFGAGRKPEFGPLFEHFAANLALSGGVALLTRSDTRTLGGFLTLVLAAAVMAWGFRRRTESFVLYAFVYAVIAIDTLILDSIGRGIEELVFLVVVGSMVGAIAALFAIHARFRRLRA